MAAPASAAAPPGDVAAILAGGKVGICDDDAEWPPYVYYQRAAGRKTTHAARR